MTKARTTRSRLHLELNAMCERIEPVGSRVTCNPPPAETDEDFLVFAVEANWSTLRHYLLREGWRLDGSEVSDAVNEVCEDDRFNSFSKDGVNLIVTRSESFFRRFMAASSVAKRLNLLEKPDRIALFQAVLYGNRDDVPSSVAA